jgi:hypothetical protein
MQPFVIGRVGVGKSSKGVLASAKAKKWAKVKQVKA